MDIALIPRKLPYARLGYAAAALFTPKLATVAIGAKPSEMTPAAMAWAALFASREAALGALTLESEHLDTAMRRKVLLANAAIDAIDTVAILALIRRQRSSLPLFLIVPAGVLSVISHIQAAQQLGATPGGTDATFENAYATA